jgi:DNA-binding NarL/FixJ family response regulator
MNPSVESADINKATLSRTEQLQMQSPPIRVLLLDQHTIVREGVRLLLESQCGVAVVGEAGDSQTAIMLADEQKPDIVLLELNLDGELNAEVIADLLQVAPMARIILLTGIEETPILQLAVQMGAMGVVAKSQSSGILVKAIQKVHAGEVWIDRIMMANVLTTLTRSRFGEQAHPEAARIAALSDRERQVITLIGEGLKNREIASRLSISEVTVRHHLTSIYNKLGVADRLELTIYAYRNGLAALPT